MPISISGSGTITGISTGGLPDGCIATADLADSAVTQVKLGSGVAQPSYQTFASSGTGATAHLVAELFNSMAQIKARHIPYKGSAPAMTDVINGQVSYTVETVASVVGHVRSGRLKTFGVTTARRAGGMPDVPTLAEAADLKDLDIGAWIGYAAPSGVPREIVLRLSNEMHKALQENALKEKL
ncbi:MAG: tripartite tricarboxylate transporter substrate binding protein, partial [Micrococcales bacterium]|nr:tripartite tricarboxylate transporter substrate binding protein [Micrococcales bacterium]